MTCILGTSIVQFGNSRKPCSGYKMKEMTGSGIFVGNEEEEELESGSANPTQNKTGIRMYQVRYPSKKIIRLQFYL